MKKQLDLTKFKFPQVSDADMAFPTFDSIPELLAEAELRGFDSHNNEYCQLFCSIFFGGGTVVPKQGIEPEYYKRVWRYLRAFMGSWAPKHEHKEAICAMLMSEIVEPKLAASSK